MAIESILDLLNELNFWAESADEKSIIPMIKSGAMCFLPIFIFVNLRQRKNRVCDHILALPQSNGHFTLCVVLIAFPKVHFTKWRMLHSFSSERIKPLSDKANEHSTQVSIFCKLIQLTI
jgi:hypothetical protein